MAALGLGAAERECVLHEQDERLLARLFELRLDQIEAVGDEARERE